MGCRGHFGPQAEFLAGTLEFKCNLQPLRHVLGMCELSLKSKPSLVVISFNLLLTSHSFVDALRSSMCSSSFPLGLMSIPCCCKNSIAFVWLWRSFCILHLIRFSVQKPSHSSQEWNIPVLVPLAIAEIFFFPLISIEIKKPFRTRRRPNNSLHFHFLWSVFVNVLDVHRWLMLSGYCLVCST